MITFRKLLILSAFLAITIVGCSPTTANIATPSVTSTPKLMPTNTQLPSPTLTSTQTLAATNTPESSRDLSTPSTRLIGHWSAISEREDWLAIMGDLPFLEMWIGEIGKDGTGLYTIWVSGILISSEEDETEYNKYQVISENGDSVTIEILIKDEDSSDWFPIGIQRTFEVARNGETLRNDSEMLFQYINSSTEP